MIYGKQRKKTFRNKDQKVRERWKKAHQLWLRVKKKSKAVGVQERTKGQKKPVTQNRPKEKRRGGATKGTDHQDQKTPYPLKKNQWRK